MPRKSAPWMRNLPPPKKYPIVFAVLPWTGDGRYKLDQAVRVYKSRGPAEKYADKDPAGALVVREIDLSSNRETVLALFQQAWTANAPNLERGTGRPRQELTGLHLVTNEDTGEAHIANDQEEFYLVVADPEYKLRFIQEL